MDVNLENIFEDLLEKVKEQYKRSEAENIPILDKNNYRDFVEQLKLRNEIIANILLLTNIKITLEEKPSSDLFRKVHQIIVRNMEPFKSILVDSYEEITRNLEEKNEFMDDVSEVKKMEVWFEFLCLLELMSTKIIDRRQKIFFFEKKIECFLLLKNWINFQKVLKTLDDPVHHDYVAMGEYFKTFLKAMQRIIDDLLYFSNLVGGSLPYKNKAIQCLDFLIRLDNVRRGSLDKKTLFEIKKKKEVVERTL